VIIAVSIALSAFLAMATETIFGVFALLIFAVAAFFGGAYLESAVIAAPAVIYIGFFVFIDFYVRPANKKAQEEREAEKQELEVKPLVRESTEKLGPCKEVPPQPQAEHENTLIAPQRLIAACSVCGRPMPIINGTTCDQCKQVKAIAGASDNVLSHPANRPVSTSPESHLVPSQDVKTELQKARTEKVILKASVVDLINRYGPNHPLTKKAQDELNVAKQKLDTLKRAKKKKS
jgi:hypothetical protein